MTLALDLIYVCGVGGGRLGLDSRGSDLGRSWERRGVGEALKTGSCVGSTSLALTVGMTRGDWTLT